MSSIGLHVGHGQDRDYENALVELLLDYVRGWPWQRPKCPAPEIPEGTGPGQ